MNDNNTVPVNVRKRLFTLLDIISNQTSINGYKVDLKLKAQFAFEDVKLLY